MVDVESLDFTLHTVSVNFRQVAFHVGQFVQVLGKTLQQLFVFDELGDGILSSSDRFSILQRTHCPSLEYTLAERCSTTLTQVGKQRAINFVFSRLRKNVEMLDCLGIDEHV